MTPDHRTTLEPPRNAPALFFVWSARLLPTALGAQFLLAGFALFGGRSWEAHSALGGLIALPVLTLVGSAWGVTRLRRFRWWASAISSLYVIQIALASGGPSALAFHPFNAALLLLASFVLILKVERGRGRALQRRKTFEVDIGRDTP